MEYHFADDINITLSDSSQETLEKRMNYHLRKLSMWLKADKLSLNIEKSELVLFQRQNTKLNNSFKIKLDGKILFPTGSVKYLGVLLDEHLTWSPQISHVQMKLNRAIGILSKLRYQANIHVPKTVYHSLFWNFSSLCLPVMGSKQQRNKISFELSKTEHYKNSI